MAYAIMARCAATGQLGIALAGAGVALARHCESIRPGTGAAMVLGEPNPAASQLALNLMAQGFGARHVLEELLRGDPQAERRLHAVLPAAGAVAARTGSQAAAWAGHRQGDGWVVLGDGLRAAGVLDAMGAAFEGHTDAGLDERMLAALEAARDAGGLASRKAETSAGVITYGRARSVQLFLRVDLGDHAIAALRDIFDQYKAVEPMYALRVSNPAQALTPAQIDAAAKAAAASAAKAKQP